MVLALVVLAAQWASRQPAPSEELSQSIMERITTILKYSAFVPGIDFTHWDSVAAAHQGEYGAAQTAEEYANRVTRVLRDYGVSHIGISAPGEAIGEAMETFGFDSKQSDGQWIVTRVFAGTEAEQAGLYPGLVLESKVHTDNDRVVVSFYDANHALQAKVIHREKTVLKMPPELLDLDKDASVLEVRDFGKGYDPTSMDDLIRKASAKPNLIIDLRGNVGGYPKSATQILGYFLPAGTRFGATISRDSMTQYFPDGVESADDRVDVVKQIQGDDALVVKSSAIHYAGHLAVLIDGKTRSTGEVVAQALKDYGSVPIFGTASAGEALEMIGEDLPGGYTLYFPIRDYWTAKGERIEGNPIAPDFPALPGSPEAGLEPAPLQWRALRWLRISYPNHGP